MMLPDARRSRRRSTCRRRGRRSARAQLTIDMTRPTFEPVPIAIVDFAGDRVGADIANVVRNDLQNSGLFRSIPPGSFIQEDVNANAPPQFRLAPDRRAGVVVGQVGQAGGNIKVDFRLWDVVVGNQAAGLSFTSQPANWRRVAHIIADAIYKRVTGEEGYFDTRIAYVAESGPGNARVKRIAIMDQDGANNRYITDGRTIAITPRFSPTLQEIAYMAYAEDRSPPRVYLQNVDSGRRELLGNFPGMSFAPRFSPDGTKVVMSISENGQSDIYEMDARPRPATAHQHAGHRHLAVLLQRRRADRLQLRPRRQPAALRHGAGGGGERRISFGEGRYATPVWSPRGDWIAFTKITAGAFGIGVMRARRRRRAHAGLGLPVEGPTWAPNGRVLAFFRQQPSSAGRAGSVTACTRLT